MSPDRSVLDLSGLDPAELAEAVGELDDEQLAGIMTSELREAALDEVFQRFPEFVDAAAAASVQAAIAWEIAGPGRARDRFLLVIDRGECRAGRELDGDPDLTLELDAVDFLRLVTGTGDPTAMLLTGRLRAIGDGDLALGIARFFRVPGGGDAGLDPADVDADAIARVVAGAGGGALKEGMRGPFRDVVLDEIFRRFPEYLHTEKTRGMDAVVKFKLGGRADGGADRWLVHIEDGDCRAEREGDGDARATISMDGADFLRLVTGNANPPLLFMRGKLRVHGDLLFAAQLAGLFKIPGSD